MKPNSLALRHPSFLVPIFALGAAMAVFNAFGGFWRPQNTKRAPGVDNEALSRLAALPMPKDEASREARLRFLGARVKSDPDDFGAQNRLAGALLQQLHDTGDVQYLNLALRAAHDSLRAVPAAANSGGLTNLAQAEFAGHNFLAARDHGRRLVEMAPRKADPYAVLGDALLELGDYPGAGAAFAKMQKSGGGTGVETRLARFALLHGDTEGAQKHLQAALALALDLPSPPRRTVAWCCWQLGETAFSVGDLENAEKHLRAALAVVPDDFRASASLGRVLAARGDLPGAIENLQKAVDRFPDPTFVATLSDLLELSGRHGEAAQKAALVEAIGRLGTTSAGLYSRQLALFYADHDVKSKIQPAYAAAQREYATRRDIYGADALAWTAFKAGDLATAQKTMPAALRLGTRDARLFYHAGLIALAAGKNEAARAYLKQALDLNPHFDPLQAPIAAKSLADLTAP